MKTIFTLMIATLFSANVLASTEIETCSEKYESKIASYDKFFRTLAQLDNGSGIVYVTSVIGLNALGLPFVPALVTLPLAVSIVSNEKEILSEVITLVKEAQTGPYVRIATPKTFEVMMALKDAGSKLTRAEVMDEVVRLNDSMAICDGSISLVKKRKVNGGKVTVKHKRTNSGMKDIIEYLKTL